MPRTHETLYLNPAAERISTKSLLRTDANLRDLNLWYRNWASQREPAPGAAKRRIPSQILAGDVSVSGE